MDYMAVHTVTLRLVCSGQYEAQILKVSVLDTDLNEDFNDKLVRQLKEHYPDTVWNDLRIIQIDTKLVERPGRFEALGLDTWTG